MKNFQSILFFLTFTIGTTFVFSCGNGANSADQATHGEGQAYTSAYICPMHCEGSGSETEGKCPVCGMAYVKKDEHVKDGHKH